MYIRVKKIRKKNKDGSRGNVYRYAYIVENSWLKRRKSAKQKVKKYLGRVVEVDKVEGERGEKGFFEHYGIDLEKKDGEGSVKDYLKAREREEIVTDLVKLELLNHGFKEEVSGKYMVNGDLRFDIKGGWVSHGSNSNVALAMNEGYLCRYLVKRLGSGFFGGNEKEVGYKLAKAFVEAGLKVPKEIFVGMFKKVVK